MWLPDPSEIALIFGEMGAGKTTLLRVIAWYLTREGHQVYAIDSEGKLKREVPSRLRRLRPNCAADIERFVDRLPNNCYLMVDEIGKFLPSNVSKETALARLVLYGRNRGIGLVATVRRPHGISPILRECWRIVYSFAILDPDERIYMSRWLGRNCEILGSLRPEHFKTFLPLHLRGSQKTT